MATLTSGASLIGRYVILDFIAEGGMQQVFKARDTSFDRLVAVKVPKNDSAEKRFARSARVSARITHANVAKTLDYFEDSGRPYLVEELIVGQDLGKALDSMFLYFDPHLAAHVVHRLARAVSAAHHAGVVHRDLKPSNIMVSVDPGLLEVKITDFGIAKMAAQELTEAIEGGESTLSGSSTAIGALPYMAPEMIEASRSAGKPADIWAVGAILFRLLSGDFPFGSGLKAVPAIITAKLPAVPDLLFRKSQFSVLTHDLWPIVEMCLKRDPDDRPSADQLVEYCAKLCYSEAERQLGVIQRIRPGRGRWGLITAGDNEQIFYHEDSYYGNAPAAGTVVNFACFDGSPYSRAFPVLPLKSSNA